MQFDNATSLRDLRAFHLQMQAISVVGPCRRGVCARHSPKRQLYAFDVVLFKVPLCNLVLSDRNPFPRQPQGRLIKALIEDQRQLREMTCCARECLSKEQRTIAPPA